MRAAQVVAYGMPEAAIELRFVTSVWPRWQQVRQSTLEFSGIRLRKAAPVK